MGRPESATEELTGTAQGDEMCGSCAGQTKLDAARSENASGNPCMFLQIRSIFISLAAVSQSHQQKDSGDTPHVGFEVVS